MKFPILSNRNYFKYLFFFIPCLIAVAIVDRCERSRQQEEIQTLQAKLAHARVYKNIISEVLRDSSTVATHEASTIDKRTYKKEFANRELLKELNVKPRDVLAQADVATSTGDSVRLALHDSVFFYRDTWGAFRFSLRDSSLSYQVRDSLSTFVVREYKHGFLFWKWGARGYKIKIVNFNPHSKIIYSQYIKIE